MRDALVCFERAFVMGSGLANDFFRFKKVISKT